MRGGVLSVGVTAAPAACVDNRVPPDGGDGFEAREGCSVAAVACGVWCRAPPLELEEARGGERGASLWRCVRLVLSGEPGARPPLGVVVVWLEPRIEGELHRPRRVAACSVGLGPQILARIPYS
eukprot:scaffold31217_cov40-Tisochrysis_lutea.AAC.1